MDGKISADLTAMPVTNLIVIFAGILILMVAAAILIKKFNLNVDKGSIRVSDYEHDQHCQTLIYHLGESIDNIDYESKNAIRRQTKVINYKIAKIGNINDLCQTARRSLFHAFKEPFYDYINANHFTRELKPDNFTSYRSNLIEIIHEKYEELMYEYKIDDCEKNAMTDWENVFNQFEKLVDEWLLMVMAEVKKACALKIKQYELISPEVASSKHWKEVIDGCISKNQTYISNINELIKDLSHKYEAKQ